MYNELLKDLRSAKNNCIIVKDLIESKINLYTKEIEKTARLMKEHENEVLLYSCYADANLSAYLMKRELEEILKYVNKIDKSL